MNKKFEETVEQLEAKEEKKSAMFVGKIHRRKKKSSVWLEKKRRKRTRRNNGLVDIEDNQKHRTVRLGKTQGTIRSSSSSNLPALCWSSASLMCHLTSKHHNKRTCIESNWSWLKATDSDSTTILLNDNQQILFHPRTSSSTQVILADRPLPSSGKHYWEIYMPSVYGTSIMFGIATKEQKLKSTSFTNLIGMDHNGWALSHHGLLWHNGMSQSYLSKPIETLRPCLVGLEFDADARTLSYTIDNQSMGIAFRNIPRDQPIYPAVSSTSAQSTMVLKHRCKTCSSLKETCLGFLQSISGQTLIDCRILPKHLVNHLNYHQKTVSI